MRPYAFLPLAALLACGGDTGGPEQPATPSAITVSAGAQQTAEVGTAVTIAPAVRVTDAQGKGVAGVSVPFTVTGGGGSVSGSPATTDANGVARVGSWTLGTAAGTNTLTAGAAGASVTFTATAHAGAAATMTVHEGQTQSVSAGSAAAVRPAVKVVDRYGNPVAGATVTFAGGGTITGGTATTDAAGIARVGSWIPGTSAGSVTLTASLSGLPAVTFTATVTDPCLPTAYLFNGPITGTAQPNECTILGATGDVHGFTLATQNGFTIKQNPTQGLEVRVRRGTEDLTYPGNLQFLSARGTAASFVVPAGTYTIFVGQTTGTATPYTVEVSPFAPSELSGCIAPWVATGTRITGVVDDADCASAPPFTSHLDRFGIMSAAGQTRTITTTTSGAAILQVLTGTDGALVTQSNAVTSPSVTFTSVGALHYIVNLVNVNTGTSMSYTINF